MAASKSTPAAGGGSTTKKRTERDDPEPSALAKRKKQPASHHGVMFPEVVETVYRRDEDVIFNYGRLQMTLRNEAPQDEIHIKIIPNPVGDGSKIVRLKASVVEMADSDTDDSIEMPSPKDPATEKSASVKETREADKSGGDRPVDAPSGRKAPPPEGADDHHSGKAAPGISHDGVSAGKKDRERKKTGSVPKAAGPAREHEEISGDGEEISGNDEEISRDDAEHHSEQGAGDSKVDDAAASWFLTPTQTPLGLPCIGKTSYRTVCIQAIAHSAHMRRYLHTLTGWNAESDDVREEHRKLHEKNDKACMSCSLRKVAGGIWGESPEKKTEKYLANFHTMVQSRYDKSKGKDPENLTDWRNSNMVTADAATAMDWFLEQLTEEHKKIFPGRDGDKTFTTIIERTSECGNKKCKAITSDTTLGHVLILQVRDTHKTLEDAIGARLANGQSSEPVLCEEDRCNASTQQRFVQAVTQTPDVLFIQLQPEEETQKNHIDIAYGPTLELEERSGTRETKVSYDLVAVISYVDGQPSSGHYLIHARSKRVRKGVRKGVTYRLDDNWCRKSKVILEPSKLTSKNGQRAHLRMLVYERTTSSSTSKHRGRSESESSSEEPDTSSKSASAKTPAKSGTGRKTPGNS